MVKVKLSDLKSEILEVGLPFYEIKDGTMWLYIPKKGKGFYAFLNIQSVLKHIGPTERDFCDFIINEDKICRLRKEGAKFTLEELSYQEIASGLLRLKEG